GISGAGAQSVVVNIDTEFEYIVLDDELIFNEWSLDPSDTDAFDAF
ncbi:MAG: hypothetical protein HC880_19640, partial [Bacteroidia bacterium]|nr:hypothetical protein [Bacteroidia bacterium]